MFDLGERSDNHDTAALSSRAQELSSTFDMVLFTIDCDDDGELAKDNNDIARVEDESLACGISNRGNGATGNEFALASRTSQIISGYRDYLSEMETVSMRNQILANEMDMLRDSLGFQREHRGPPEDLTNVICGIDIDEERVRSSKYSQSLIRSHQFKKRAAGLSCIFLSIVGVAVTFRSAASAAEDRNKLSAWNKELAKAEFAEAMREEERMKNEWKEKERIEGGLVYPTSKPQDKDKVEDDSPAMKMIEAIIAHPEDIKVKLESTSKSGKGAIVNISGMNSGIGLVEPTSSSKSSKSGSKSTKMSALSMSQSMSQSHDQSQSSKSTGLPTKTPSKIPAIDEERDYRLHLEEAGILYQAIDRKYKPKIYNRSQGWTGYSFADATIFCASHYPYDGIHIGVPCPFEAYCPEGPNSLPYGGNRVGPSYAPIMDDVENWLGWVQLSEGHSCEAYNYLTPEPNAEQTGIIMCCRETGR
ncbi:hypothetical protein ACHAW5_010502 [Stephanodiscus triporus]|uniref:DUF7495 domain-containing protein n=1 Tax=Stephanodiscus triporus TaxID=2934178 RepID=A0ABD3PE33_9STRA